jgi:hypothetical protein
VMGSSGTAPMGTVFITAVSPKGGFLSL